MYFTRKTEWSISREFEGVGVGLNGCVNFWFAWGSLRHQFHGHGISFFIFRESTGPMDLPTRLVQGPMVQGANPPVKGDINPVGFAMC